MKGKRSKLLGAAGLITLLLVCGPAIVQASDTTLIFAEGFNQDLSRWAAYVDPNSTVQLQTVVYNSSPSALLINLSEYQAAAIHEITPVNADYAVEFLFYPENVSFKNYGLYSDFQGPINRISLTLQDNLTLQVGGILTQTQFIPACWNKLEAEISYNGSAEIYVNGESIGVFPINPVTVNGICLGTWPERSEEQTYSGAGYFDDLKVYITPIPPPEPEPEPEQVNITSLILVGAGIGVGIVGVVSFLVGRLYFMGKEVGG